MGGRVLLICGGLGVWEVEVVGLGMVVFIFLLVVLFLCNSEVICCNWLGLMICCLKLVVLEGDMVVVVLGVGVIVCRLLDEVDFMRVIVGLMVELEWVVEVLVGFSKCVKLFEVLIVFGLGLGSELLLCEIGWELVVLLCLCFLICFVVDIGWGRLWVDVILWGVVLSGVFLIGVDFCGLLRLVLEIVCFRLCLIGVIIGVLRLVLEGDFFR